MPAPKGSAANPRSRAQLGDHCPICKTGALWSNFFNADGDAVTGDTPGARWLTVCQSCSDFFETGRRAR